MKRKPETTSKRVASEAARLLQGDIDKAMQVLATVSIETEHAHPLNAQMD